MSGQLFFILAAAEFIDVKNFIFPSFFLSSFLFSFLRHARGKLFLLSRHFICMVFFPSRPIRTEIAIVSRQKGRKEVACNLENCQKHAASGRRRRQYPIFTYNFCNSENCLPSHSVPHSSNYSYSFSTLSSF